MSMRSFSMSCSSTRPTRRKYATHLCRIVASSSLIAGILGATVTATTALAFDTIAASSPGYTVGGGGGGASYYTGTHDKTPYGNSVCFESLYDVGRFGMLGACAKASAGGILEDVGNGFCAIVGALQVVDASQGEFKPTDVNNVMGILGCLASAASVVFQAAGAADTPSHAPSP